MGGVRGHAAGPSSGAGCAGPRTSPRRERGAAAGTRRAARPRRSRAGAAARRARRASSEAASRYSVSASRAAAVGQPRARARRSPGATTRWASRRPRGRRAGPATMRRRGRRACPRTAARRPRRRGRRAPPRAGRGAAPASGSSTRREPEQQLHGVGEHERHRDHRAATSRLQEVVARRGRSSTPSAFAEPSAPASSSGRNGRSPHAAARPRPRPM